MTYGYDLTKKDLENIGITPGVTETYYIEQSGWSGKFGDLIEVRGALKGNIIKKGTELTLEQQGYIIKNVKCKEY